MSLESILTIFGLNEKEAKVYLASVALGTASVYEIAEKSGLKRPTTYLIVEDLLKKGLISLYKLRNKTYYTPLPPKRLIKRWESHLKRLNQALPEFESLESGSLTKPFVQFYEGKDGITALYEELDPDPYHPEEMLFFGSIGVINEILPERLEHWYQVVKDKRVVVKELLDKTKENIEYVNKVSAYKLPHFEARFLPSNNNFGPIDCALVGGRIYIISLIRDIFGIKIHNHLVAETFRTMFRLAWIGCLPQLSPNGE